MGDAEQAVGVAAAAWVEQPDVLALLDRLLANHLGSHPDVEALLPEGGFLDAHVHALVRLLDKLSRLPSRKSSDRGVTLHVWLFHFLGGAGAKLLQPAGRTPETLALYRDISKRAIDYKSKLQCLESEARRPAASVATIARLHDHRALAAGSTLLDECVLRLRPAVQAVQAAGGGSDSGGGGDSSIQAAQTARLVAFAMGTHHRLREGYASRDEPCAVCGCSPPTRTSSG